MPKRKVEQVVSPVGRLFIEAGGHVYTMCRLGRSCRKCVFYEYPKMCEKYVCEAEERYDNNDVIFVRP